MLTLLVWSAISLFGSTGALANNVKRAPVEWSVEQCSEVYVLASQNLTGAPLECAKISYVAPSFYYQPPIYRTYRQHDSGSRSIMQTRAKELSIFKWHAYPHLNSLVGVVFSSTPAALVVLAQRT
jgi:hypothetical protein